MSVTTSDDDDLFQLLMLACGAIATGTISLGFFWDAALKWLVQHQIVVTAQASPLLVLPASAGAGLDLPRTAIAAAAVLALLIVGAAAIRRLARTERV